MPPMESHEVQTTSPKSKLPRWAVAVIIVAIAATLVFIAGKKEQPATSFDPTNPMQEVQVKDIIAQGHSISAKIDAIDHEGKTLSFSTKVLDLSNLSRNDMVIPSDLPTISKTYTIRTTSRTSFEGKQFAELVVGDVVVIQAKEGMYEDDTLTATTIKFWDEQKEQLNNALGDPHILFGAVRNATAMGDGTTTLTVESEIPDKEKLLAMDLSGSYAVPYVKKIYQVVISSSLNEPAFKVGMVVRVTTDQDVYATQTIMAKEVSTLP